jgi:hypothetical protein
MKLFEKPYAWRWDTWYKNLHWYVKCVKWFWQRGSRGYADCDVWGIDWYLAELIPSMLEGLKNGSGYPSSLHNQIEWNNILDKMIKGFAAARSLQSMDFMDDEKGDIINDPKLWKKRERKQYKVFKRGMRYFTYYFLNLWD